MLFFSFQIPCSSRGGCCIHVCLPALPQQRPIHKYQSGAFTTSFSLLTFSWFSRELQSQQLGREFAKPRKPLCKKKRTDISMRFSLHKFSICLQAAGLCVYKKRLHRFPRHAKEELQKAIHLDNEACRGRKIISIYNTRKLNQITIRDKSKYVNLDTMLKM